MYVSIVVTKIKKIADVGQKFRERILGFPLYIFEESKLFCMLQTVRYFRRASSACYLVTKSYRSVSKTSENIDNSLVDSNFLSLGSILLSVLLYHIVGSESVRYNRTANRCVLVHRNRNM